MNYDFYDILVFCLFVFGIIVAVGGGLALSIRMIRVAITGV